MADHLTTELETYEAAIQTLSQDMGKFVLIRGQDIIGKYDSYNDALQAGYEKFGITPFLVKKIAPPEQVQYFSRDLIAHCLT